MSFPYPTVSSFFEAEGDFQENLEADPDFYVEDGSNDLPAGYRWAEEHEMGRKDAVVVPRTFDVNGNPYTQDEADVAVPV